MDKYHIQCLYCGFTWFQIAFNDYLDINPCTKCNETENFKATKLVNTYE